MKHNAELLKAAARLRASTEAIHELCSVGFGGEVNGEALADAIAEHEDAYADFRRESKGPLRQLKST